MDLDLDQVLEFTKTVALEAGKIILDGAAEISKQSGTIGEKLNAVDLVTEWDLKVEKHIKDGVAARYPSCAFVGEESYDPSGGFSFSERATFCVDPIDGTTNFVHGFPFACVSIGFVWNGFPTIGVIYNPFLDQLFFGRTGHGSYLVKNGATHKLPLSGPRPLPSLSSALIAVEWGSVRSKPLIDYKAAGFSKLAGDPKDIPGALMCHSLRSLGSAALNFATVATGGLDLYWEIGCWPWDVCAGAVIAQEAGCLVSGGKTAKHDGKVTEEILTGRKYIVVRGVAAEEGKTSTEKQKELVDEFYRTVEEWDPS